MTYTALDSETAQHGLELHPPGLAVSGLSQRHLLLSSARPERGYFHFGIYARYPRQRLLLLRSSSLLCIL